MFRIFGPPGTGKTTTLLTIVEKALQDGVTPSSIAFLAFTRKAAQEAKTRACQRFDLDPDKDLPHFRTLHSLAYRMSGVRETQLLQPEHFDDLSSRIGVSMTVTRVAEDDDEAGITSDHPILSLINLARLRKVSLRQQYDLSSIQTCISGAAPLPPEVQGRFQELTGARLVEGYGLSEASPITHGNPAFGESRIGTIGLPCPDTEVKIVDPDAGTRILDIGQPGEMCVRGPQVMKAYWQRPSETANALRADPAGGEPWLYTGDIASMDEDGYFRIVDRKKDLILGRLKMFYTNIPRC